MKDTDRTPSLLWPGTYLRSWWSSSSLRPIQMSKLILYLYACPFDGFSGYQWFLYFSWSIRVNFSANLSTASFFNLSCFRTSLVKKKTTAAISFFIFPCKDKIVFLKKLKHQNLKIKLCEIYLLYSPLSSSQFYLVFHWLISGSGNSH